MSAYCLSYYLCVSSVICHSLFHQFLAHKRVVAYSHRLITVESVEWPTGMQTRLIRLAWPVSGDALNWRTATATRANIIITAKYGRIVAISAEAACSIDHADAESTRWQEFHVIARRYLLRDDVKKEAFLSALGTNSLLIVAPARLDPFIDCCFLF